MPPRGGKGKGKGKFQVVSKEEAKLEEDA